MSQPKLTMHRPTVRIWIGAPTSNSGWKIMRKVHHHPVEVIAIIFDLKLALSFRRQMCVMHGLPEDYLDELDHQTIQQTYRKDQKDKARKLNERKPLTRAHQAREEKEDTRTELQKVADKLFTEISTDAKPSKKRKTRYLRRSMERE